MNKKECYVNNRMVGNKIIITKRGGLKGLLDIEGNLIIPLRHISIDCIGYGYTIAQNPDNSYCLYDNKNNLILDNYYNIRYLKFGYVEISKIDGIGIKYGIYSIKNKEIIIPPKHKSIDYYNYSIRSNKVKHSFIVDSNKIYSYEGFRRKIPYDVYYICGYQEGFAVFMTYDKKYGILDIEGTVVFKPDSYDFIYGFINGGSIIKKNGLYGMINYDMKFISEPKYANITDMNEKGLAAILTVNNDIGFIDKQGVEHIVL